MFVYKMNRLYLSQGMNVWIISSLNFFQFLINKFELVSKLNKVLSETRVLEYKQI